MSLTAASSRHNERYAEVPAPLARTSAAASIIGGVTAPWRPNGASGVYKKRLPAMDGVQDYPPRLWFGARTAAKRARRGAISKRLVCCYRSNPNPRRQETMTIDADEFTEAYVS